MAGELKNILTTDVPRLKDRLPELAPSASFAADAMATWKRFVGSIYDQPVEMRSEYVLSELGEIIQGVLDNWDAPGPDRVIDPRIKGFALRQAKPWVEKFVEWLNRSEQNMMQHAESE